MGELNLQAALSGLRPLAEDFEDESGSVDDLDLPGPLQIALLDWAQGAVHHDELDIGLDGERPDLFDLPRTDIG